MLWMKAFHVVFVVTWFAGLFYLPRLFIYHAEATDALSHDRFVVMERRLFVMMTIGAAVAALLGLAMVAMAPGFLRFGWLHAKLLLVAGLIGYHVYCGLLMRQFRERRNTRSSRWLRLFNEVPGIFLIAIVILAIVKPF